MEVERMRKKVVSLILTVVMLCAFVPVIASAETSGTCGDNVTWRIEDGVLIFSGTGEMHDYSNVLSPMENLDFETVIFEKGITYIGDRILYGCRQTKSVSIPDTVTEIGKEAFAMTSIQSLDIPNSVVCIGKELCYACRSLSEVSLSEKIVYIPKKAFYYCNALQTIEIPENVSQIGVSAFENTSLINITIPQSVLCFSKNAFAVLTPHLWYINDVEYTGIENIYYGGSKTQWKNIKKFTGNDLLGDANMHYNQNVITSGKCGDSAYWNVKNGVLHITGKGEMSDYVDYENGYPYPIWLTCDYDTVKIEEGITRIGIYAFDEMITCFKPSDNFGYSKFQNEELEGIQWLEDLACYTLDKVKTVIIPKSVSVIVYAAFDNCKNLTDIYYEGTKSQWSKIEIGNYNDSLENATIHYNSSYTIPSPTPIPTTTAKITKTETAENYTFEVNAEDKHEDCYVYAVTYDENGTLLGVNKVELDTEDNTTVSVNKNANAQKAKVFILADSLQPIIDAKVFELK